MTRPTIVCLCGSSRFKREFEQAARDETLAGRIVLSLGLFSKADGFALSDEQVRLLKQLHQYRIDLADEILVINPGGYVGDSTADEIDYALGNGKKVRWLIDPV